MKLKVVVYIFFLITNICFAQTTISSVEFQGNTKTKSALLKKITKVKSGQLLDSTAIANDIARIIRLPAVAHAYFQVKQTAIENNVQLIYGIEENFTIIPFANVFTSNNNEFAFRIGVQEFNFLGQNITLGAFYQNDIFNSYGLGFRAPYLFSNKLGMAINYQDLTTQEPVFLSEGTAEYRYNNTAIEVLGIYEFNLKHRLEFGLNFFNEDYNYITGATNTSVPQELNVDKFLYKLLYNYENLTYYYHYLDGFKSSLNVQLVRSRGNQLPNFWIAFNDFTYYKRTGKKGNWANRLRIGVASNVETPFAPFAVDNNLNVRGVGNLIDRGTAAIVLNTEFRYSLIEKDWFVLQSNMFVDGGSWRKPGGDFNDFFARENLRLYPGFGLRFIHKKIFNAIFRIDYGYGITPDASQGVVFGIGQYF